ncbi:MAG: FAD-dependent oxidoreductase [Thermomicrobiales bacterium]|nr:FAD-dependent oxidoreductase [Thermomicrobiales bacterium]
MDDEGIVVIGAGIAGLTCAIQLHAAGYPVAVYEANDAVGGRVRTDRHSDGFLLDRGFQVILDAYPALRRHVDLDALDLGRFDAGAMLFTGRRLVPLADPRRHPAAAIRDVTTRLLPVADKARLAAFALTMRTAPWTSAREAAGSHDRSALAELQDGGFSAAFIERFARPFWGGISLDPTLGSTAGELKFTLKMFLQGFAALPAGGMQALPDQLARRLPSGAIRLNRRVDRIEIEHGRVTGIMVHGETIPASAVVVATDPPTAKSLTGFAGIPERGVGCVTVYLRGRRDPNVGKRLVLDSTGRRAVNHLAPHSAVAPSYAPPGEHLLAAIFVGEEALAEPDDDKLVHLARTDAAAMLRHDVGDWRSLGVVRVPFSQFAQPPGIHQTLPRVRTATPGLYLSGEMIVDSSQNGAFISGETAADAIVADRRSSHT